MSPRTLLLAPLLFLLLMVAGPMLRLAWEGMALPVGGVWPGADAPPESWGPEDAPLTAWGVWQDAHLRFRLLWSLAQAGISTALTLLLGLPVAWVLARFRFAGRLWVLRLLMLPFVVPTLVAALGVLALWGPGGHWSQPLGLALEDSPWLLIIGNLFFNLCLVVRAAADALGQVSASRLAAARTLGATPWRAFWRVEWPAIRLAVASALCLVFLYCFAGMGLALVLGGQQWATAEVEIYTLVAHELRLADASALALWTLALGAVVAGVHALLARRLAQPRRADRVPLRPLAGWHAHLAVAAALLVLGVVSVAPLLATVVWALADLPALWAVWSAPETLDALWNTTRFSAMALVAATALGLCQGLAVERLDRKQRALLRRHCLGFVFQGFNLLARTSALENVELPLIYRGVPTAERHAAAREALARVGLAGREKNTPGELSGGQQQRVAIARAIVTEPTVLLADEPTGNLDTRTSEEIMELITGLNHDQGITVLMVTHEPDMAAHARRVVRFVDGRVESDTKNGGPA